MAQYVRSRIYSEIKANQNFDRIHDFYVEELKRLFHFLKKVDFGLLQKSPK